MTDLDTLFPARYVWVITHHNADAFEEEGVIGTAGPYNATPEMIERAKRDGVTFRMLDDDGIWYYRGKLWFPGITKPEVKSYPEYRNPICLGMNGDEEQEFGPLNDFGMPNAGATEIQFRCDDPDGNVDGGQPVKVWATL